MSKRIQAVLLSFLALSACQTGEKNQRNGNFPIVVGSNFGSDVRPCIDYAARFNNQGEPYRVPTPSSTGKIIMLTRHEGMDFCYPTGTPVYAAASGEIHTIKRKNERRGGWVVLKTDFSAKRKESSSYASSVFLSYLHIVPREDLGLTVRVEPGDLIGHLIDPGSMPELGGVSHLHFAASTCDAWWTCHTDPNRFWQDGPGNITCLDPARPPPAGKIVSPIGC